MLLAQPASALHRSFAPSLRRQAPAAVQRLQRTRSQQHPHSGELRRTAQASVLQLRKEVIARVGPVAGAGFTPELKDAIDNFLQQNKVVVFMKGTRQFPQCGFSNTVVQILNTMQVPYETVNILEEERLRTGMKEYSQWPTFPQVYIDGEFFGGCDIMIQAFQNGELKEVLERALMS